MRFVNFVGNEKIKEQLAYLIEADRLPHAIIIEGETGLGKRTLAREIALNLFCRGEDKPCMVCPQCKKLLKGVHPDLFEYTAADKPSAFHVKRVREIRDDAFVKPNEADYKIYILGNAQSMNASSQNAILKILEEPPEYAVFILTVTNKSAMLPTVLSRSVVLSLSGVESAKGANYISQVNEEISYDAAYKALEIQGGNIGKAIESLSDGRLAQISEAANELARAVIAEHEYELLKTLSVFVKKNADLSSALAVLKTVFRDALLTQVKPLSAQGETAALLSERLSREKLFRLIAACDKLKEMADRNANNSILITKVCAELRRAAGR